MKTYLKRLISLPGIEFGVLTLLYVVTVLSFVILVDDTNTPRSSFETVKLPFDYYGDFFFPTLIKCTVIYLSFVLLVIRLIPRLIRKEKTGQTVLLTLAAIGVTGVVLGFCDSRLYYFLRPQYGSEAAFTGFIVENSFLQAAALIVVASLYTAIKYAVMYLNSSPGKSRKAKSRTVLKDVLRALGAWIISLVLLLIVEAEGEMLLGWTVVVLTAILIYGYSFYKLLPKSAGKPYSFLWYWLRVGFVISGASLLIGILLTPLTGNADMTASYVLINAVFQAIITAPATWLSFRWFTQERREVVGLEKELGQSNASLDVLRMQINPHFLFNVLNTIYGTAIMEQAERTGEAIEKLADMMRFMLHENTQETIPLTREIEYLNNYIGLQRLRNDPNLAIDVQIKADPPVPSLQIAPMLLIPFVENAFKHGISLREPSHISLTLAIKDRTLNFDVRNSRYVRSENDPEKHKSGIGLLNVKQRLQIAYPAKHELIIRQTETEFFTYLTIQLA